MQRSLFETGTPGQTDPIIIQVSYTAKTGIEQMWTTMRAHAKALAQNWFTRQCADNSSTFYCYYIPCNNQEGGKLAVARSENELPGSQWVLTRPEPLSRAMTVEQGEEHIYNPLGRLSILAPEKPEHKPAQSVQVKILRVPGDPPKLPPGHFLMNAQRPLLGCATWQGQSNYGIFYARISPDPRLSGRKLFDENVKLDACLIEYVNDADITEWMMQYCKDQGFDFAELDAHDMQSIYWSHNRWCTEDVESAWSRLIATYNQAIAQEEQDSLYNHGAARSEYGAFKNLSRAENDFLAHIDRFGSEAYPITKYNPGKWRWDDFCGVKGAPVIYKTKREATQAVETYLDLLRDRAAGRMPASPDSKAYKDACK